MGAFASLLFSVALGSALPALAADTWVIHAAKIYPAPDAAPIEDGVVLVRAGRITYVGKRDSVRNFANVKCVLRAGAPIYSRAGP